MIRSALTFISLLSLLLLSCSSDGQSDGQSNSRESDKTYHPDIQTSIGIDLTEKTAAPGDTVCMDVRVSDWKEIVSVQHSINWDPAVATFTGLQGFNLTGLSANNFGLTQTQDGKIAFSWYDPAVKGISLPDGQVIYQLCLQLKGEKGAESKVRITNDPVVIEVSNADQQILGIPTGKGILRVN